MLLKGLQNLKSELEGIDKAMEMAEDEFQQMLQKVHPSNYKSACNLLHYLVLRSLDMRNLQDQLHASGLSSLASSENHIRGQLISILQRLGSRKKITENIFDYRTGKQSLHYNASMLFGKRATEELPYIMVTLDTHHAKDYAAVKNLLQSGMNVARINCAHDNETTWFRMLQHIRRASRITGLPCKVYMDLAGPKIRSVFKNRDKLKVREGQLIFLTDEIHLKKSNDTVGCTVKGIAKMLKVGEKVLFDDGLIEARVERVAGFKVALIVMRISSKKPFIKIEKGINFPESQLKMSSLTDYDKRCLSFIAKHADMVGFSFVRNPEDIGELQKAMGDHRGISMILKIETPQAVKNLPHLLMAGLQQERLGVMIARGDLAVEIGFERLSEVQEEILWISEAAHVPVIWATQVLENLNKSGIATRSEITDAVHASYADCVMLNKGQHIIKVMETIKDIFLRSGGHHVKKRYTFRPLEIAKSFMRSA